MSFNCRPRADGEALLPARMRPTTARNLFIRHHDLSSSQEATAATAAAAAEPDVAATGLRYFRVPDGTKAESHR